MLDVHTITRDGKMMDIGGYQVLLSVEHEYAIWKLGDQYFRVHYLDGIAQETFDLVEPADISQVFKANKHHWKLI